MVTSHPLNGLDWLLEVWANFIHNKIPWAELHIFSNLLSRKNENYKINNLKLKLYKYKNRGIVVKNPLPQRNFIENLSNYRAHLYPSKDENIQTQTILESQASGIPIVSRKNNIIYDNIYDNETGYITDDKDLFSYKTIELLQDKRHFLRMSNNSRLNAHIKKMKDIVHEFESFLL